MENRVKVLVTGREACFTRPETPVERYSYDVITPAAARGILTNIYWKPEFEWRVMSVTVLNPIRRFERVVNEVDTCAGSCTPFIDATESRTQRITVGLSDVAYVIEAVPLPLIREDGNFTYPRMKFVDSFNKIVARGARFIPLCLGMSHMRAQAHPAPDKYEPAEELAGVDIQLGRMFLDFGNLGLGVGFPGAVPIYFSPVLSNGTYTVPQDELFGWNGRPYTKGPKNVIR